MNRRAFNSGERVTLWLAADGKCSECGAHLEAGWHADHVTPYSKGGQTNVVNGQALCGPCNRRKGDGMNQGYTGAAASAVLGDWPQALELRKCQADALTIANRRISEGHQDALMVLTPAAGKTLLALAIAHNWLCDGVIERVVVVCPTSHLKTQIADAAANVGIHLDPSRSNQHGLETPDMHGMCVTYGQVLSAPELHARGMRRRTLVVVDEIHHAGTEQSWGRALETAFADAAFRLSLSGTPFRSKGDRIPFVHYEGDPPRSAPDHSYGYARAVADGLCRVLVFPSYDSHVEWCDQADYKWRTAKLSDDVDEVSTSRQLKEVVHPQSEWLGGVMRLANDKLTELRANGHLGAGGLIVCHEQRQAEEVAERLRRITGEEAIVAVSDKPDASEQIERFKDGSARWIVAVKMVSEGVDIPRLRIAVYASNVTQELYFRQVAGRIVRRVEEAEDEKAYLFIPRNDALLAMAQEIKVERDHEVIEELDKDLADLKSEDEQIRMDLEQAGLYIQGSASAPIEDVVIVGDTVATPAELERVRAWREQHPRFARYDDEDLLEIIRELRPDLIEEPGEKARAQFNDANANESEQARHRYKQVLSRRVKTMAARLAFQTGAEHWEVNRDLKRAVGKAANERTVNDQERAIEVLEDWLRKARGDG